MKTFLRLPLAIFLLGLALGLPALTHAVPPPESHDIFVSSSNTGPPSTIEEYTPAGQHVRSIPAPNNTGSYAARGTEYLRGIAVNDAGQIVGFNGTFSPELATFLPNTRTFTARTVPGWTMANNGSYGSVGVFQGYSFVINGAGFTPNSIIRFNADGTSQTFGEAANYSKNYINLTVGLDGKLYVLYSNNSYQFFTDVYDPVSLQFLRTVALQVSSTDLRNLAVNAQGEIYAIELYNDVYHLDANGNLLQSASHGHGGYTDDVKIDPISGRILISVNSYNGIVLQTDANLSVFTTLITLDPTKSGPSFIAFGNDKLDAALNTTHILWDNTNGAASIWNYDAAGGTFTQNTYGPYPNWTAKAIADGGTDSLTRVLWDNADGTMSLWSLNNTTAQFTQFSFGPYPGWTATALSVSTDNTTHVLWNNADGRMSLWNYNTARGSFSQNTYGPYSGWTAKAIADGGTDGKTRVLWTNTNGTMSLWSLDNVTASFTQNSFGPYAGWTANAVSVAADNTTHVLWNNADGRVSLWNYSTADGSFTQNTYGSYSGWRAVGVEDGPDGKTHLLWDNTDGTMSLWNLDNTTGVFSQFSFGPYAGWTATGVSGS